MHPISQFVENIIEGRDPGLAEHQHRASRRARAFGERMGCGADEVELFLIGVSLHDIGKLAVSEAILNKSSRLSRGEFEFIKQHPALGERLLEPLAMDPQIVEIVRFHHENYDGTGYPEALAGDRIPFMARAARIVDSFEALIENRPYHRGVDAAQALAILKRDVRFYDPELLSSFCATVEQQDARVR